MKNRTRKLSVLLIAGIALAAVTAGCSHQASGGDSLAQQRANVMGSPAPPAVRAQIDAQMASQRAAQQAAQQAAATHRQPTQ